MTELRGATVLVTGGASGIGRLVALSCAAKGSRIVLWDIDAPALDAVADEIRRRGADVVTAVCDLGSRHAIEAAAAECGAVDVLVNNAGIVSGKPLLETTPEQIERTFAVNALAPIWTTRAFLAGMIERKRGHIVNVSSAAAISAPPRLTDYAASKWALVGFDEALRLELRRGRRKVRTTIVCPFYIKTGLFEGAKTRFRSILPILEPEAVADRIVGAIEGNKSRVVMPRFVYTGYVARVLPIRIYDALMSVFGISRSMDDFVGRTPGK
ncbi:MAG: SDR family oxidoreductase [Acidimicrobiia bacterium]